MSHVKVCRQAHVLTQLSQASQQDDHGQAPANFLNLLPNRSRAGSKHHVPQ